MTLSLNTLANAHCRPLRGREHLLAADAVAERLALLGGWTVVDGVIEKTWRFGNFHETMAFVNAVAFIAHVEDHHPDLDVGYGSCRIRFHTHDVGGLSENDFICAARIERLASDRPAAA